MPAAPEHRRLQDLHPRLARGDLQDVPEKHVVEVPVDVLGAGTRIEIEWRCAVYGFVDSRASGLQRRCRNGLEQVRNPRGMAKKVTDLDTSPRRRTVRDEVAH